MIRNLFAFYGGLKFKIHLRPLLCICFLGETAEGLNREASLISPTLCKCSKWTRFPALTSDSSSLPPTCRTCFALERPCWQAELSARWKLSCHARGTTMAIWVPVSSRLHFRHCRGSAWTAWAQELDQGSRWHLVGHDRYTEELETLTSLFICLLFFAPFRPVSPYWRAGIALGVLMLADKLTLKGSVNHKATTHWEVSLC